LSCEQELLYQPLLHLLKKVFEKIWIEINCTQKTHWLMAVALNLLKKNGF